MGRDINWSVGFCKQCENDIRCCSSDLPDKDMEYYCENPDCENHKGSHHGDQEEWPEWIDRESWWDRQIEDEVDLE